MRILFITHETSRTGAPMVLLYFLRWIRLHNPYDEVSVLSLKAGDLNQEFHELCTDFYDYEVLTAPDHYTYLQRLLIRLGLKKVHNKATLLYKKLSTKGFDIVYSNTIKSIPIGIQLKRRSPQIKHIAHIHELGVIIKQLLPELNHYIKEVDHVIAPSDLVKHELITNWGVSEHQVNRVYEFSEVSSKTSPSKKQDTRFHVGGSGTVHWRKGHDLFIQVAHYIRTHYPNLPIYFTWVGKLYRTEQLIIDEDLRKLHLQDVVNFDGEVEDTFSIYDTFDVFLMTSREDPFPLVCIEVGMLGKPIISFEQATGANEIITKGGGFIVPYLNVEAMAKKVIFYIEHHEKLLEHGLINAKEFSKFTPENLCPDLYSILKDQIA